jgi:N-6 DNA Methylase
MRQVYDDFHSWLGWPPSAQVFAPEGAGARVFVEQAQKKIGGALKLAHPGADVRVGVISPDPDSDSTEVPLAIVCEFPRSARPGELDLVHRLAWSFSRTALLVTLEPQQLVAWSCYQDPKLPLEDRRVCELPTPAGFNASAMSQQHDVRKLLHWVSLVTSRLQRELPGKFPSDGRADVLLLKNLRHIRQALLASDWGQEERGKEFCHDLLARTIFTQFLFHRKDSNGEPFFSQRLMKRLHDDGTLSRFHVDLVSVLSSKHDTYALFRWMDIRFNGDLFPGKDGQDDEARDAAWRAERNAVKKHHLDLLAELIAGNLDTLDRQLTLWPYYSFDAIPLEFISSIYEQFLTEERRTDKAYYTPPHLVDYVLDAVLPWNDENWNVRILDPCCGSGIFLVKAFQRLIYRWRLANRRDPLVSDLKPILANNLVGIDKNREAVRVACFSLYLAMADAIEPKHYVTRENVKVFPPLRGSQLIVEDFFDENTTGFRTEKDAQNYDLVIGNAPWGDGTTKATLDKAAAAKGKKVEDLPPTKAQVWADKNKWPVPNHDIGPVFLGKAARLASSTGRVAMVQTASILNWRDGTAEKLRSHLFTSYTFDEITNLSALRRDLFSEAIGPACVIVFGTERPNTTESFHYFTPKPMRVFADPAWSSCSEQKFAIEPQNTHLVSHHEAATDPTIWPALSLGGRRDLNLLRRLRTLPNLAKLKAERAVHVRMGVIPGDQGKEVEGLRDKRYFDAESFPVEVFLELDAAQVPKRSKIYVDKLHGVKTLDAFRAPQLLIKQSLSAKSHRFRAALVKTTDPEWGVVCKKTYLSVHDTSPDARHIRNACVVYNSLFATYFLGLTSSRIGHYITETLSKELDKVPLPIETADISKLASSDDVDREVRRLLALTDADWCLIEDFLSISLPDALRKTPGPARVATTRRTKEGATEPELSKYAGTFMNMLHGTFGEDRSVAVTIYSEPDTEPLPCRMLTVHLDHLDRASINVEKMQPDGLLDELGKFHEMNLKQRSRGASGDGLGFQRVAYLLHAVRRPGVHSIDLSIVKPDECRYWTRSVAMRDADQLSLAIMRACEPSATERS